MRRLGFACGALVLMGCVGDAPNNPPPVDSGADTNVGVDAGGDVTPNPDSSLPDAGQITPAALGLRLAFWYTPGSLASGAITSWKDEGPNANDAVADLTACQYQPDVGQGPNGLKAAEFAATTQARCVKIPDAASLKWGTGDYLVVVVAKYTNSLAGGVARGAGTFYSKGTGSTGIALIGNYSSDLTTPIETTLMTTFTTTRLKGSTLTPYNDGAWRIYGVRRKGQTVELYVNSTTPENTVGFATADVSSDQAAYIGRLLGPGNTTYFLEGAIAEMIGAGKAPITDQERDGIFAYLKAKYKL